MVLAYRSYRSALLVALAVVTVLGLACAARGTPGGWLRNDFAGVLYEVFWILLVALWTPRAAPGRIATAVFAATCAVEFSQLWKPAFLEVVRGTVAGGLLLGTTFAWLDFPYYLLGSLIGWLGLHVLGQRTAVP